MIKSLSYVGFTSPNAEQWNTFAPEVLGAQLAAPGPDGAVRIRVDDHAWRIAVHPGAVDDLAYIGWEVGGATELDAAVARLEAAGVDVHVGDDTAAERAVTGAAWFVDPFGFRHELVWGRAEGPAPFAPGRRMGGGFVTGDQGLGHIVLIVPDFDAASAFYLDTLGFELSDDIDMGLYVRFAHCNPRHHSLAFTAVPGMVGVHHLMLEVEREADVDEALTIAKDRGLPLAMDLGQHTNDEMYSFYVRTPSGFEVEYGSGGRLIDTTRPWTPEHFDHMSQWGHEPPTEILFPGILKTYEATA